MRPYYSILLWLLPAGILLAEEKVTRDVEFAKVGDSVLAMDIHHPPVEDDSGPGKPLVVWVHGGAWSGGNRKALPIKNLVAKGFVVASVDYRLSTIAPYPANVHDIKAAIRFLRANAGKYRIDSEQISIAGVSAGGHLAALVGLTHGSKDHEGTVGDHLETSSDVRAVVSFFGASNLLTILDQSTPHGLSVRVPALNLLLGGSPAEKPALARLASPVHQLDRDDPPLLLIHGDQDPQMPIEQSQELKRACDAIATPCQLIVVPGGVHGGMGFYEDDMMDRVAGFLKKSKR